MNKFCIATLVTVLFSGAAAAALPESGLDTSGADPTVRPQDDIFRASNGGWLARTQIPADKPYLGYFTELDDVANQQIRAIVESMQGQHYPHGSIEQKVSSFYGSFVDTQSIDKAGLKPMEPFLKQIEKIKDKRQLIACFGAFTGVASMPISLTADVDAKHPERYTLTINQGGLEMPDRDYYLTDGDPKFEKARTAYRLYLEKLFTLAGIENPKTSAETVYALEKKIAQSHWSKLDNRDPNKLYNPMSLSELSKAAPEIDWPLYIKNAAFPPIGKLVVSQPSEVKEVAQLIGQQPLQTWKLYLTARILSSAAYSLPEQFREARFTYRGKAIFGLEQEIPRWKMGVKMLNESLGEGIGQFYVAKHFPPEAKSRTLALVNNLMEAFADSLDGLTWMSPETKKQAKIKLSKYLVKIGYPEKWRDYSKLEIIDGDAVGNTFRASRFEHERIAARVGAKVDRSEWSMSPQTVNAYYNSSTNEISFPAVTLQPPFFNMKADDAVNYGAIGALIGHEISHGFDDEGSQYDGDGRLNNWWSEADRAAFKAAGEKLAAQFDAYQPLPGKHVNGKLTLGENIADLSGLQTAYKAYKISLHGKPSPVIDGLTGEQRFFLGWAQAWREKIRDEFLLFQITADPHSPSEFRANGAVINNDGFHEAFGTRPGDKLYKAPAERIHIW